MNCAPPFSQSLWIEKRTPWLGRNFARHGSRIDSASVLPPVPELVYVPFALGLSVGHSSGVTRCAARNATSVRRWVAICDGCGTGADLPYQPSETPPTALNARGSPGAGATSDDTRTVNGTAATSPPRSRSTSIVPSYVPGAASRGTSTSTTNPAHRPGRVSRPAAVRRGSG